MTSQRCLKFFLTASIFQVSILYNAIGIIISLYSFHLVLKWSDLHLGKHFLHSFTHLSYFIHHKRHFFNNQCLHSVIPFTVNSGMPCLFFSNFQWLNVFKHIIITPQELSWAHLLEIFHYILFREQWLCLFSLFILVIHVKEKLTEVMSTQ